jgi:hypothetical protein
MTADDLCGKKMEILMNLFTLLVIAFFIALGFILSPYEIIFEDGDEIEW